jgi:DNA mismatch repair protein MutS
MNIDTGIYKVIELIDAAITDPNNSEDTQISCIRSSFDEEISRLSQFISNSHSWLDDYRMRLIEESGIQSLKIKYTSASGYFIEISKSQLAKIPESFTHKQTLVNASRFISDELMQYEKDLMNAEELLKKREQEILEQIRLDILVSDKEIRQLA